MWTRKKTIEEKSMGRQRWLEKRKITAPTRSELVEQGVDEFCRLKKLCPDATQELFRLLNDQSYRPGVFDLDYRQVNKNERIPRSLQARTSTPPNYWKIYI